MTRMPMNARRDAAALLMTMMLLDGSPAPAQVSPALFPITVKTP